MPNYLPCKQFCFEVVLVVFFLLIFLFSWTEYNQSMEALVSVESL